MTFSFNKFAVSFRTQPQFHSGGHRYRLQRIARNRQRKGRPIFHITPATPDGSPLLLRDTGTEEIYALDWKAP